MYMHVSQLVTFIYMCIAEVPQTKMILYIAVLENIAVTAAH